MSSRLMYSKSLRRRPTILSRPRREAWSCLWVFRCSVSSAMRCVRTATCTSADPVSPLERACSWMISLLASLVSVMVAGQGYQHLWGADGPHERLYDARMSSRERLAALCGLLGPVAFTAAWLVAQRRQDEYQFRHEHISGLAARDANDPHVMTAGFVALGGCTVAFA